MIGQERMMSDCDTSWLVGLNAYVHCPPNGAPRHVCPSERSQMHAWLHTVHQGVKLTVARSPFATNMSTRATNFHIFSDFRRHCWRLCCSCVHSYSASRLVGLVCSVYTMSDQLQATRRWHCILWASCCTNLWLCIYIASNLCSAVHSYCAVELRQSWSVLSRYNKSLLYIYGHNMLL